MQPHERLLLKKLSPPPPAFVAHKCVVKSSHYKMKVTNHTQQ